MSEPPSFLDLAWRKGGHGRWIAARTPLAAIALENGRKGLAALGIQARDRLVEWDLAAAPGEPVLSRRLASMEKAFRGELARCATRDAAYRPVEGDALADVQNALAEALARNAWAFRSKGDLAQGLAQAARLTPGQCRLGRALLCEARDMSRLVTCKRGGHHPFTAAAFRPRRLGECHELR